MALSRGTKVGGDFLDLGELAADGPVLMIFRIVEFLEPEPGDFGALCPVIADVLVCSGASQGEVHLGEKFIGAPTGPLRGVKNPKGKELPQPPVTEVGNELAFRVTRKAPRGSQPFIALDVVSDVEYAAMREVYADGAGWAGDREPAMAGAGAPAAPAANGTKRPWG
jgi:hypothetical protein